MRSRTTPPRRWRRPAPQRRPGRCSAGRRRPGRRVGRPPAVDVRRGWRPVRRARLATAARWLPFSSSGDDRRIVGGRRGGAGSAPSSAVRRGTSCARASRLGHGDLGGLRTRGRRSTPRSNSRTGRDGRPTIATARRSRWCGHRGFGRATAGICAIRRVRRCVRPTGPRAVRGSDRTSVEILSTDAAPATTERWRRTTPGRRRRACAAVSDGQEWLRGLGEGVFGLIGRVCAAPADMVVGPDEHSATLADLVRAGPRRPVGIGIVGAVGDRDGLDSDAELLGRDRRGSAQSCPFGADDQHEGGGGAGEVVGG